MNHVVLIGRLTKDPELRYIPGTGTPVATFTLAIDREYTKKDGTKETDFIPIKVKRIHSHGNTSTYRFLYCTNLCR